MVSNQFLINESMKEYFPRVFEPDYRQPRDFLPRLMKSTNFTEAGCAQIGFVELSYTRSSLN